MSDAVTIALFPTDARWGAGTVSPYVIKPEKGVDEKCTHSPWIIRI